MAQRTVNLATAQISKEISNFTVGFAKLSVRDRVEDAVAAGSGTFAAVGSVHGVLTAAHVLDALPNKGKVGLVLYQGEVLQFQKQTIEMEHAEKVVIRGEKFGPNGPDLGFMRLPQENVGWLNATSSFYNLLRRRDDALAGKEPAPSHINAIIGMIDELTEDLPPVRSSERRKGFRAIFCNGEISRTRNENGHKLLDFVVTTYPDFDLPASFEGMSGGAVWRLYFVMKGDSPSVVDKRLIGIPFYQDHAEDGTTTITCHGPDGIYRSLLDEIVKKWPDASK